MKNKILLVMIAIMTLVMVGCNKSSNVDVEKGDIENKVENVQEVEDTLEDLVNKTPLTLEDLDRIDVKNFPVSYVYEVYEMGNLIDRGEYVYPADVDHKLLLPIHENMVARNIISSVMDNDIVYTTVDVVLDSGETFMVKYLTDPDTMKYLSASVNGPTRYTLYNFRY